MRITATTLPLPFHPAAGASARRGGGGLARALGRMARAIRTRRQLAAMDQRMLSDIGMSRLDALREAGRAPWDTGAADWHPRHCSGPQPGWDRDPP
jgi:uncharacterized protein YjiS (DUF1127 family)